MMIWLNSDCFGFDPMTAALPPPRPLFTKTSRQITGHFPCSKYMQCIFGCVVGCLKLKRMKYPPLPFLRDEKDVLSIVISITGLFFCVCVCLEKAKRILFLLFTKKMWRSQRRENLIWGNLVIGEGVSLEFQHFGYVRILIDFSIVWYAISKRKEN